MHALTHRIDLKIKSPLLSIKLLKHRTSDGNELSAGILLESNHDSRMLQKFTNVVLQAGLLSNFLTTVGIYKNF